MGRGSLATSCTNIIKPHAAMHAPCAGIIQRVGQLAEAAATVSKRVQTLLSQFGRGAPAQHINAHDALQLPLCMCMCRS